MSRDYPDRSVWLAHKHERLVWSKGTFRRRRPGPVHVGKSFKRRDKKMRMAALYASFFNDPAMIERIDNDHGLMHLIEDQPRLVRDTVLGSRVGA